MEGGFVAHGSWPGSLPKASPPSTTPDPTCCHFIFNTHTSVVQTSGLLFRLPIHTMDQQEMDIQTQLVVLANAQETIAYLIIPSHPIFNI